MTPLDVEAAGTAYSFRPKREKVVVYLKCSKQDHLRTVNVNVVRWSGERDALLRRRSYRQRFCRAERQKTTEEQVSCDFRAHHYRDNFQ